MNFWRFLTATHISRANCAEIAGDRLGQPTYKSFTSLNFAPPPAFKEYSVRGRQTWVPLENTRIRPLKRQQPRETVAPSGVYVCIVPNVICWDR